MKAFAVTFSLIAALLPAQASARAGQAASRDSQTGAKAAKPEKAAEPGDNNAAAAARPSAARLVEVLRSVADEAPKWDDAAAAASVQARIADILWQTDPAASQAILVKAWEAAGRVSDEQAERSSYRNYLPSTVSRRAVINVARRRAPELAERWLAQMAEDAKESKGETPRRGAFDDRTERSTVLLEMALQEAADNPRAAAELAGASLQDGVSYGLNEVLVKLQQRDPALAQAVFARALERLRTAGISDVSELLILTAYLFTPGYTRATNTSEDPTVTQLLVTRDARSMTPPGVSNPALAQEFVKLAASLLVNAPLPSATANPTEAARAQLSAIGEILYFGSFRVPEVAAALEARRAQILQDARYAPGLAAFVTAPPPASESEIPRPLWATAPSAEDLEEEARKETSAQLRDTRFAEAALATEVEKYERGFALAGSISDAALRANVTNLLAYRASLHFAKRGDGERAYQLSRKNTDPAQRAAGLVLGTQALLKAKNAARAREWLEEAQALARRAEPDAAWARTAFGVAAAYAQFDAGAGVEALGEAVRLMNRSPEKADAADERAPPAKRFGGFRGANVNFTNGTTGFGLHAAARAFPAAQFENVLGTLDGIDEGAARGRAVVALCAQHFRPAR
ncbi:MAG TPA: hypothetical protein VK421_05200 [Pyrinomonadaceae bacterium]|nr:hypothetical protein [Pyrinomonadaceae bacterium]